MGVYYPTAPIQCLMFNGFGVAENLNLTSGQVELIVTSPVTSAQLAAKQDLLTGVTQNGVGTALQTVFTNFGFLLQYVPGNNWVRFNFKSGTSAVAAIDVTETAYQFNAGNTIRVTKFGNSAGYAITIPANSLNVTVAGTLTQNSDERLKTEITDLPHSQCQEVFDALEAKQYKRTDFETDKTRCGFIAQEVKSILPEAMQNIVASYMHKPSEDADEEEYYGIDYARLAAVVLWGVTKNQQTQIKELKNRIEIIESKL